MRRWTLVAAALALAFAAGCDEKDKKDSGQGSDPSRAVSPRAAAEAQRSGVAGDLVRYAESGGTVVPGRDTGRELFDGSRALGYAAAPTVQRVSYVPSSRPALRYTSMTSYTPRDLELAAPPAPSAGWGAERYAGLRAALIRSGSEARVVDEAIGQAVAKGMDPLMILAIGSQESGLRSGVTSPVGARGAMQLMPATACGLGVCDTRALYDPRVSVHLGTEYFKQMWGTFVGSDMLSTDPLSQLGFRRAANAIAAYNAGPGAVQKYGGVPPYAETQDYVRKVIGYYQQFRRFMARSDGISV